jgi:hypothetical protein
MPQRGKPVTEYLGKLEEAAIQSFPRRREPMYFL